MQTLELRLGLDNIMFQLGMDVSVWNLEIGCGSWCMGDLHLLVRPGVGQDLWCPSGAQAVAEHNRLVPLGLDVIADPDLDHLVRPGSWLPPHTKMLEQLWAAISQLAPGKHELAHTGFSCTPPSGPRSGSRPCKTQQHEVEDKMEQSEVFLSQALANPFFSCAIPYVTLKKNLHSEGEPSRGAIR